MLVIKDENVSFLSSILPGKVQLEIFRNDLVVCVVIFTVACFSFFFIRHESSCPKRPSK